MSDAKTTRNHEEIRRWVEARGGWPASVKGTAKRGTGGLLRIDFPGYSGAGRLEKLDWDEFFRKFDEEGLEFLYQDRLKGGKVSRFFKFVEGKKGASGGSRKKAGSRSAAKASAKKSTAGKKSAAKKSTAKKGTSAKKRTSAKKGTSAKKSAAKSSRAASSKGSGAKKASGRKASTTKRSTKASSSKTAAAKKSSSRKAASPSRAGKTSSTSRKKTAASKKSGSSARSSSGTRKSATSSATKRSSAASSRKASSKKSGTRGSSGVTTDHEKIRQWVEERGGRPACVRGTGGKNDVGMLRIDFPGYSGEDTLQEISWDEFFRQFDENKLGFLHQDRLKSGAESRFFKLVSR